MFDDIRPDTIKIGMLFSVEIIELVSSFLKQNAKDIPIVLDPVMVAKSGDFLLKTDVVKVLKTKLVPIVNIITPNLPEPKALIPREYDKKILSQKLLDLGCRAVLLKVSTKDLLVQMIYIYPMIFQKFYLHHGSNPKILME